MTLLLPSETLICVNLRHLWCNYAGNSVSLRPK